MNPGRLFMPWLGQRIGPMTGATYLPIKGNLGVFRRFTTSLRSFNWNGLLNGANKTLNVVNQTIPLVRQAGPMFNNMRSMLKLAKVFGNETTINNNAKQNTIIQSNESNIKSTLNNNSSNEKSNLHKNEILDYNYPNFFV